MEEVALCNPGKPKLEFLGSSSDSTLRKLEFEMRLRALDSNSGLKNRVMSQKGPMYKSVGSILGERASSARRRDESTSIYYRSPLKQSRVVVNEEKSQLNESRSLLARMKDEFRTSTNNSFSGNHQRDSRIQNSSSDHIMIKSIMIKPKVPFNEPPLEDKKISLQNLKSEFYTKLSKQRKEVGKGGTLENLFNMLSKDGRSTKDPREGNSMISRSKYQEPSKIGPFENRSEDPRMSSTRLQDKSINEKSQIETSSNPFPTQALVDLTRKLAEFSPEQIDSSNRKDLILLRAQIKKLISS